MVIYSGCAGDSGADKTQQEKGERYQNKAVLMSSISSFIQNLTVLHSDPPVRFHHFYVMNVAETHAM